LHMKSRRDESTTVGGLNMPPRFVLTLISVILGTVAVAFYLNGNGVVAIILAIVALAVRGPYMRERERKRGVSGAPL
jgi:hypothetical protein